MTDFLKEPVTLFPIRPNRSMGGISGYITISESATDKLTITKHPVQQGANISDHAYKEPSELTVSIMSSASLTKTLDEIYQEFLKLQNDRVPFEVVTGKRSYSNMLIASIGQTTDKLTENALALTITLTEVIIVDVVAKTVPRSKQSNPGKTGATEKTGRKSALKVLKEGIGNIFGG